MIKPKNYAIKLLALNCEALNEMFFIKPKSIEKFYWAHAAGVLHPLTLTPVEIWITAVANTINTVSKIRKKILIRQL